MLLSTNWESNIHVVPENSLTSPTLAAYFGTPSPESLAASVKAQLEKYCTPGFESDIPAFMASYETKIRELDVRFEVAIGAIEDESGELIIQLRKEREALMTTAGTWLALANLHADGKGRAGTARIMEGVSIA